MCTLDGWILCQRVMSKTNFNNTVEPALTVAFCKQPD